MPSPLDLPEPWFRPDPAHADQLEREAVREIGQDHELVGRVLTVIAKCAGCDEVLFRLGTDAFALVHLAWAKHPEPHPWPATRIFASQLAAERASADHATRHSD